LSALILRLRLRDVFRSRLSAAMLTRTQVSRARPRNQLPKHTQYTVVIIVIYLGLDPIIRTYEYLNRFAASKWHHTYSDCRR